MYVLPVPNLFSICTIEKFLDLRVFKLAILMKVNRGYIGFLEEGKHKNLVVILPGALDKILLRLLT